ncbi:hypothetical protein TRFO_02041 [Tritrichomonas foetus]|uniref:Condensation domain-containing protein n=1 Tax=Tritrichomonas foetus TaxID=1144522 RepID=A0A1J4JE46_9EUKA|nr:hypothetical protein TRFO_02041 [Tritrichomonas foetus]|eukprot:OHS96921.1 hypothetical protein TRFO_02041 [Tritrichomonas foetus]
MKMRPASIFELDHLLPDLNTQLGIEISRSHQVPEFIDRMKKLVIGLYLSFDGKNLISHNDAIDIIKLPKVDTIQEACEWFGSRMVHPSKRIGAIAANDKFIVLNLNHAVGDGGTFVKLVRDIQNPDSLKQSLPTFPIPAEEEFSEQLKRVDSNFNLLNNLGGLTRAKSKCELPKNDPKKWAKSFYFRTPVSQFKCWNEKDKKCQKLTENLWLSLTLSMNAFEGKLGPIGCATCVDLRNLTKFGSDSNFYTNIFSLIFARAPVSPSMTVGELGNYLRSDFNHRKLIGEHFYIMSHGGDIQKKQFLSNNIYENKNDIKNLNYLNKSHMKNDCFDEIKMNLNNGVTDFEKLGSHADLSQLAPFVIKDPIKDVWLSVYVHDNPISFLSLLGQSVVNLDSNTSIFGGRLQYRESKFTNNDAFRIMKSINYFLQNITFDRKVGDVYEELKSFQNSVQLK